MLHLSKLLLAVFAFQPPSTPLAPPAVSPIAIAPTTSALARLDARSAKIVTDRARDIYILPNGIRVDAYRLHQIRELLRPAKWKEIDVEAANRLGVGHHANDDKTGIAAMQFPASAPLASERTKYQGLPDLVVIDPHDRAKIAGWVLFVKAPSIESIIPDLRNDNHFIASDPVYEVKVTQVLSATEVLAKINHFKNTKLPGDIPDAVVHLRGAFGGFIDGEILSGDFFLAPCGTFVYESVDGGRRTVADYRVVPLDKVETPDSLALAIEAHAYQLNRYQVEKSTRRDEVTYAWKTVPQFFHFRAPPVAP